MIKSKPDLSNLVIVAIAAIAFLVGSGFLFVNGLSKEFLDLGLIIPAIITLILGLLSIWALFNKRVFLLKKDKIQVLSIFGSVRTSFLLSDILSYKEIDKEDKYSSWTDLTLYTKKGKFTIHSKELDSYQKFRKKVTKGVRRDREAEERWKGNVNRTVGIVCFIIGFIFFVGGLISFFDDDVEMKKEDLTEISGTLSADVEVYKGGKSSRDLKFYLSEFPEFEFSSASLGYRNTRVKALTSEVTKNDPIQFLIEKEVYQKYIRKEVELDFWDKQARSSRVFIYQITSKGNTYLALENYNQALKEDASLGWIPALLGLGFMVFCGRLIRKNSR